MTPNSWISLEQLPADQAAAEKAMLKRDGFRAAVHEDVMSSSTGGASVVEQFGSPQAAADALAFYRERSKTFGPPFNVTGDPGRCGLSGNGGTNIIFSDGAYYYLVGQLGSGTAAIAKLRAAARHLYQRVHG
jgi:hypothetical protein